MSKIVWGLILAMVSYPLFSQSKHENCAMGQIISEDALHTMDDSISTIFLHDSAFLNSTLDSLYKDLHRIRTIQEHRMEIAKERLASMTKDEVVSDTEALYSIKDNTEPNFWANGWNLIGVFALIVAIWSLIVAKKTFRAQNETEKHTQKAPIEIQMGIFKDLPRHFYRNLICTVAAILRFRDPDKNTDAKGRKAYPSESNLGKLNTLPEEFILPIDVVDNALYMKMHEAKLLFRNYNIEVSTASQHLSRFETSDLTLAQDFDNLLFKPLHLTSCIYPIQDTLYSVHSREDKSKNRQRLDRMVKNTLEQIKQRISSEGIEPHNNSDGGYWNAPFTVFSIFHEHLAKFKTPRDLNLSLLPKDFTLNFFDEKGGFDDKKFETLFGPQTRSENGILRAINSVLKYEKIESETLAFLFREKEEDGSYKKTVSIDVSLFKKYFEEHFDHQKPEISTRFNDCFGISDSIDCFKAAYDFGNVSEQDIAAVFEFLKPYYAFFHDKNTLDVKQLIFLCVMLDSALEISNIGMVNY